MKVTWKPWLCRRRLPDGPQSCAGTGRPVLDILSQAAPDSFQDLFINYCHICLFLATVTITRGDHCDSILRLQMIELSIFIEQDWGRNVDIVLRYCEVAPHWLAGIRAKDQRVNPVCLLIICQSIIFKSIFTWNQNTINEKATMRIINYFDIWSLVFPIVKLRISSRTSQTPMQESSS